MYYDNKYPIIATPRKALNQLTDIFITDDIEPEDLVELSIEISNKNVNIRELTAYLEFIDRTYGRFTPRGLRRYSHRRKDQLRITSFHSGSIEFSITELVTSKTVNIIIVLYFLLKYVPAFLKGIASAYKDYQQSGLIRERRKMLREKLYYDQQLEQLDHNTKRKLVVFFDNIYQKEENIIHRVKSFSNQYVIDINIRIRKLKKRKDDSL